MYLVCENRTDLLRRLVDVGHGAPSTNIHFFLENVARESLRPTQVLTRHCIKVLMPNLWGLQLRAQHFLAAENKEYPRLDLSRHYIRISAPKTCSRGKGETTIDNLSGYDLSVTCTVHDAVKVCFSLLCISFHASANYVSRFTIHTIAAEGASRHTGGAAAV